MDFFEIYAHVISVLSYRESQERREMEPIPVLLCHLLTGAQTRGGKARWSLPSSDNGIWVSATTAATLGRDRQPLSWCQEQKQTWCLLGAEITASMGELCWAMARGLSRLWHLERIQPYLAQMPEGWFLGCGRDSGAPSNLFCQEQISWAADLARRVGLLGSDSSRAWRRRLGSGKVPAVTFLPQPTCCECTCLTQ